MPDNELNLQKIIEDSETLYKVSRKLRDMIMRNAAIAANRSGEFSEEQQKKAIENIKLINSGFKPRHNLGPGTVAGGGRRLEEEYRDLERGKDLIPQEEKPAPSTIANRDIDRLRSQRAHIASDRLKDTDAPTKIGDLRTPERTAEEQQKANLIREAKRQEREKAKLSSAPNVKRRAAMTAGNIQDAKIEFDNTGAPKYNPVFENYGIKESDWKSMDNMDKLLHLSNHLEIANTLPESYSQEVYPMPKNIHDFLIAAGSKGSIEDHEKEWHNSPISTKLELHRLASGKKAKTPPAGKPASAAPPKVSQPSTPPPAAAPTSLQAVKQPSVTEQLPDKPTVAGGGTPKISIKKSLDTLYELIYSIKGALG